MTRAWLSLGSNLEPEANLRAALRWLLDHQQWVEALALAAALGAYWQTRGFLAEGRQWLEGALAAPATARETPQGLAAMIEAGMLAWEQGDIARKYWNTAVILVPALIVTLFFSSMVAFVCSRYSWRFNIVLLSIFTAGNLLPQQIIIQPLFQFYNRVPLPDWLSN